MTGIQPDAERGRIGVRGAPPGHSRHSPIPQSPNWARPEWRLREELEGVRGLVLWQLLRDVLLWSKFSPPDRHSLFHKVNTQQEKWLSGAVEDTPELTNAVASLRLVSDIPETVDAASVASACQEIWQWAEMNNLRETALQFAEAAAHVEPLSSSRCYTAGRLCRIAADHARGVMWFRRAERVARRAVPPSEIDFANAHLGWGILEHDRGNFTEAETHFRRARRAAFRMGRHSLAAAAHHNLLVLYMDWERLPDALDQADKAATFYPAKHPRVPAVACDIGYLWLRLGHFSTATYLFGRALPWITVPSDRVVVLSLYARAAAANRDRVRFERLAERALRLITERNDRSDAALYHLAEGARSYEQWSRAEELAAQALALARTRNDKAVVTDAESLLAGIVERSSGDVDTVPDEGGDVDRITHKVLTKLRRMPAPESLDPEAAFFPENYPPD